MDKKKIIKIILIILAVIIALVLIHTTRNFCILTSIANAQAKFKDYTNYSFTISSQHKTDYVEMSYSFKDNILKEYYSFNGEIFSINWKDWNAGEAIDLSEQQKQAGIRKLSSNNSSQRRTLPTSVYATGDNIFQRLYISLISFISTEELDNQKCYLIKQMNNDKYYINKENKVVVKQDTINGIINFKNIRLNDLTDNDVARPDLTGYTVSINN